MLNFFRRARQPGSADAAKDRLQILLAHERGGGTSPDVLPLLQRDILEVIQRHLKVGGDSVEIKLERSDDLSTLEIDIELPGGRGLESGRPR